MDPTAGTVGGWGGGGGVGFLREQWRRNRDQPNEEVNGMVGGYGKEDDRKFLEIVKDVKTLRNLYEVFTVCTKAI